MPLDFRAMRLLVLVPVLLLLACDSGEDSHPSVEAWATEVCDTLVDTLAALQALDEPNDFEQRRETWIAVGDVNAEGAQRLRDLGPAEDAQLLHEAIVEMLQATADLTESVAAREAAGESNHFAQERHRALAEVHLRRVSEASDDTASNVVDAWNRACEASPSRVGE